MDGLTLLVGGTTSIEIDGTSALEPIRVELASPEEGEVVLSEEFACEDNTRSPSVFESARQIAAWERCRAGERRRVRRRVEVTPARAGTVTLRVLDWNSEEIDSLVLATAAASDVWVRALAREEGEPEHEVSAHMSEAWPLRLLPDRQYQMSFDLRSADGTDLYFDTVSSSPAFADPAVATFATPSFVDAFVSLFTGDVVLFARTGQPGITELAFDLGDVVLSLPVEVTANP